MICADFQINPRALESGSRESKVSHARAVLSYVWVRYLGRSDRRLAEELGVSPQAVYLVAARIEQSEGVKDDVLRRWCT